MNERAQWRPTDLSIVARPMEGDYLEALLADRFWHGDGPVTTHFVNAFQAAFPEGERFFIEAARAGLVRLQGREAVAPGDQLEADYRQFVAQEGAHSRQHAKWNRALALAGYPHIAWYDRMIRERRAAFRRRRSLPFRLGMVAGAEHYTASIAHLLAYRRPTWLLRMRPPFQALMLYHAMEEVEHKAVCFDLYQRLSGSWLRRVASFLFVSCEIWLRVYFRHRYLLGVDGMWDRATRREVRRFYLGRGGLASLLWPRVRDYLRPSFHPWQTDERAAFERAFGDLRAGLGIAPFGRA